MPTMERFLEPCQVMHDERSHCATLSRKATPCCETYTVRL